MKNQKKNVSATILFTLILVLSVVNMVHAVEVTATISLKTGAIAYDSGKGEIFVTTFVPFVTELGQHTYTSNSVSAISDSTNAVVANVTVGENPSSIAYDSGKREIFVANQGPGTVSVISDINNTVVATINLKGNPNYGGPTDIVYDSGKGEIFVNDYFSGVISIISDSTNSVVATLSLGNTPAPSGLIYDSHKGEIFVTYDDVTYNESSNSSNFVSVISDDTNSVVATVPVGNIPYPLGLAYDSGKGEIFVANLHFNSVSIISDSTNAVVATVPVGNGPTGLAYDSGKGEIFVDNGNDNTTSVISDSTNAVVATVPVGNEPMLLAYDSGKGEIFVDNSDPNTISVLSDSSSTSVSPSPTVPEFSSAGLILMVVAVVAVTLCAVALAVRKSTRTHSDSRQETK
jgi:YVTN family beta-propeller protein